jgi:hypothetical protein
VDDLEPQENNEQEAGIFPFLVPRQPQGVLLHRFPPLKPCANEFSLRFSYTKTLARP